jgi:aryl-alcohol dehydrogenase-like predicted oxidoreductase
VRTGIVPADAIAAGCHCIAPAYLKNQLETSLRNLRLDCVDIYYLHNPETQLPEIGRGAFLERMRDAFTCLESAASEGKIGVYGVATWGGLRAEDGAAGYLSLAELEGAARDAGGDTHRFRAVQLPINLAMPEAIVRKNQALAGESLTLLEAASRLGMIVMSSGSIYQGQLARELPPAVAEAFPDLSSDAQRALQFARSAPFLTTALVGMKSRAHVEENLALARRAPEPADRFRQLFS